MLGEERSPKGRRRFERPDEEILDQLKRSRRAGWFMLFGCLVCIVSSVVLVFLGRVGAIPPIAAEYSTAAIVIVWVLATIFRFRHFPPPLEANEERILRKRIDSIQSVWRWLTVFCVGIAVMTTFGTSRMLGPVNSSHPLLALFAGSTFVFVILLYSLMVFYGPGYLDGSYRVINDELARALHARAFKAGYLALMVMLGGVLLTVLYRPALTIPALCWTLFAGFAMPALYYVILQWRAGSGD
jgi:hypothetical protein